jgi:CelD/BcsL family acetyltransferase involved in cellulose biosynthesis
VTLRVAAVSDETAFARLGGEWNALLATSAADSLFLTWEWIATWWKIYCGKSRLFVLTARSDDGQLVGIAPLKRTNRDVGGIWNLDLIEFIGYGGDVTPEYLDFIVRSGHEAPVMAAFIDRLLADPRPALLDLRPFAEQSANLAVLQLRLSGEPGSVRCAPESVCPQMTLPASLPLFMAGRSRNYRKTVKEAEHRIARDCPAHLRRSSTADELQTDFAALGTLHHRRWKGTSRAFRSPEYLEFHRRFSMSMLERGATRLYSLDHNGTPLASLYCFAYGSRYYYYQSGRNPDYPRHHLGLVLMDKVIQEAIKEGATVFDFLRGEEAYKFRWAETAVRNVRFVYWPSLTLRALSHANSMWARVGALLGIAPAGQTAVPDRASTGDR